MKRFATLLLALAMTVCCAMPAFAAAVFAEKHTAVRHRCKELAQAGILPTRCRAKQNAAPMQLPYLLKDLVFQFLFAVLQQRTVNVAANQFD